jgi:hypothetical protein
LIYVLLKVIAQFTQCRATIPELLSGLKLVPDGGKRGIILEDTNSTVGDSPLVSISQPFPTYKQT